MSNDLAASHFAHPHFFNVAELRELLGYLGQPGTRALFDTFAEELPRYRSALEAAMAQRDLKALARTVHNLRGTALSFSCTGLAPLCESVKASCDHGDIEACRRATSALAYSYVCALMELQSLRAPGGLLAA